MLSHSPHVTTWETGTEGVKVICSEGLSQDWDNTFPTLKPVFFSLLLGRQFPADFIGTVERYLSDRVNTPPAPIPPPFRHTLVT